MFFDVSQFSNSSAGCPSTAFVNCLAGLPLSTWLTIGSLATARDPGHSYATASALVDAAVADRRLDVEAWHVRDLVGSAADYATPATIRVSRKERQAMIVARSRAERAALALLVRDSIGSQDFAALYAPFTRIVPAGALGVQLGGVDAGAGRPPTPPTPPTLTPPEDARRGA